jgi:uncharacterized membrane protein
VLPTSSTLARDSVEGVDEDRHWLAGTIYFNRDDPRVLVPKKLGFGYGRNLNLARPVSWLVLLVPIVVVVLIGFSQRH